MASMYGPSYVIIGIIFSVILGGYGLLEGAMGGVVLGALGFIACLGLLGLARYNGDI